MIFYLLQFCSTESYHRILLNNLPRPKACGQTVVHCHPKRRSASCRKRCTARNTLHQKPRPLDRQAARVGSAIPSRSELPYSSLPQRSPSQGAARTPTSCRKAGRGRRMPSRARVHRAPCFFPEAPPIPRVHFPLEAAGAVGATLPRVLTATPPLACGGPLLSSGRQASLLLRRPRAPPSLQGPCPPWEPLSSARHSASLPRVSPARGARLGSGPRRHKRTAVSSGPRRAAPCASDLPGAGVRR